MADILPTTANPSTTEEYYAQWVDQYGIDAEKIRDEGLTDVQRAYDRSSASYGATAEMLRQSGLNNSGLAGLYQNMAETNRRQGNATVYDQYAANVKKNKSAFAQYNQGAQSELFTHSMDNPQATLEELIGIAMNMYGMDPITASQMANMAYNSTADSRNRYGTAELEKLAQSGGVFDPNKFTYMDNAQGVYDSYRSQYSDVYKQNAATKMFGDINTNIVGADILDTDLSTMTEQEKINLANTYGVTVEELPDVLKMAKTLYDADQSERYTIAYDFVNSRIENGDLTDVNTLMQKTGISEETAKKIIAERHDDYLAIAKADIIDKLSGLKGASLSDEDIQGFVDEYGGYGITEKEIRDAASQYEDEESQKAFSAIYATALEGGALDASAIYSSGIYKSLSETEIQDIIDDVMAMDDVKRVKVQSATDNLVAMYEEGYDMSNITQTFVQNSYGLTEEQAAQAISDFNTITGESIGGGGSTGTKDGYTFTGTDGNEHTVSEDVATVYNDLVENFGKTGQEAIEYIKDNNGEGEKYNFSEEDIAGLDAYGVYAQAETDKAVTTFSNAVNNFVNVALNGGDFTSSLMAIRDLDPNLYASLNTADFKNEDGTWNTDKVLTGLFDYAKQDGNADLINNIGNAAVNYELDLIVKGGGKDEDGKTVYELFTKIGNGGFSDGSTEAIESQLKYVLDNSFSFSDIYVKGGASISAKSPKYAEFTVDVLGEEKNLKIELHANYPVKTDGAGLYDAIPKIEELQEYVDLTGYNEKFISYTDKDGRHLYANVNGQWVWLKKSGNVSGMEEGDWEKMWEALVSAYDRTYEINNPQQVRRRMFEITNRNHAQVNLEKIDNAPVSPDYVRQVAKKDDSAMSWSTTTKISNNEAPEYTLFWKPSTK